MEQFHKDIAILLDTNVNSNASNERFRHLIRKTLDDSPDGDSPTHPQTSDDPLPVTASRNFTSTEDDNGNDNTKNLRQRHRRDEKDDEATQYKAKNFDSESKSEDAGNGFKNTHSKIDGITGILSHYFQEVSRSSYLSSFVKSSEKCVKYCLITILLLFLAEYLFEVLLEWCVDVIINNVGIVKIMDLLYSSSRIIRNLIPNFGFLLTWYTGINTSQCIINNPLFVDVSNNNYSCTYCSNVTIRMTRNVTLAPLTSSKLSGVTPFVFKNWTGGTTLADVQRLVSENVETLDLMETQLFSSVDYVTKIGDLARDDVISKLEHDPVVSFNWMSYHYVTSQIMRKLFPRPSFIPDDMAVVLDKYMLFDGAKSKLYHLNIDGRHTVWYTQGTGSRKIILRPRENCRTQCSALAVTLTQGDILTFRPFHWSIYSGPAGDQFSVAFVGIFGVGAI